MDNVRLSVALVRKTYNQSLRWLARINQSKKQLEFVIGNRLENESFRETIIREVGWELRLDRKRDFLVSNMAQMNLEFIDRMPGHYGKSHVMVSFYNVEVYRKDIVTQLENDPLSCWVSSEEICNGVSAGGLRFDPLVPYLINRSSVIQFWESSSENK